ncbi:D-2-hydroxyacid dehydrogenase [Paenibacillus sp. LHD-117]|uniref:D-2-hydroxyacid dehydrogenase n=1 Tax=Paenibacillus sp. LHD-117 TaxID=3071412 RepID=UPI0027E18F11|nr:D-2-hydroxyacid dehydrogenase [Paenibacillus sp. LHD-117]MDQ6421286.1 D-2-hydroxyacid dehydrogenase [Paenibacillus sp. LHD-117]
MAKIVSLIKLTDRDQEQIRNVVPDWELISKDDSEAYVSQLKEAAVVVGWSQAAEEACLVPEAKLKWVQAWGAGVEKMPLEAFATKGVTLTNASGVHAYPISETILGMMLMFARKLHLSVRYQAEKSWRSTDALHEIHGKTAGIIGVGAIGEETAKLAKAFGMRVLGVRRSGEPSVHVDRMVGIQELDEVLEQSDYVINTLPLTNSTYRLIGREQLRRMRSTAIYINIGRGATTDEQALAEALSNGTIAGAGLDVFEEEPLSEASPLWEMENVIITPHNSGSTVHYHERAMQIFLRNLREAAEGKKPSLNVVDLKQQY